MRALIDVIAALAWLSLLQGFGACETGVQAAARSAVSWTDIPS